MSLSKFLKAYEVTDDAGNSVPPKSLTKSVNSDFVECLRMLGGKTFNRGLYRVYRWDEIEQATSAVSDLFTPARGNIVVFAYDWSGRQFAIDFRELIDGRPSVSCYDLAEPGTFCTDLSILEFHKEALVDKADAALAEPFYRKWYMQNKRVIQRDECVGFRIPLFLGGEDVLENLELTDMDVYLSICAQLYKAASE